MRRKPATVGAMCTSQRPGGSGAPAAAAVGAIGTAVCSRTRTRPFSRDLQLRLGARGQQVLAARRRRCAGTRRRSARRSSPVTSRSLARHVAGEVLGRRHPEASACPRARSAGAGRARRTTTRAAAPGACRRARSRAPARPARCAARSATCGRARRSRRARSSFERRRRLNGRRSWTSSPKRSRPAGGRRRRARCGSRPRARASRARRRGRASCRGTSAVSSLSRNGPGSVLDSTRSSTSRDVAEVALRVEAPVGGVVLVLAAHPVVDGPVRQHGDPLGREVGPRPRTRGPRAGGGPPGSAGRARRAAGGGTACAA